MNSRLSDTYLIAFIEFAVQRRPHFASRLYPPSRRKAVNELMPVLANNGHSRDAVDIIIRACMHNDYMLRSKSTGNQPDQGYSAFGLN